MLHAQRFVSMLVLLAAGACAAGEPRVARHENTRQIGNTLQYAVPAAAFTLTFLLKPAGDPETMDFDKDKLIHLNGSPRHDLVLALGRSFLLTQGLKYAVDERRPDGGDRSFPSGHTSIAFAGAEFIRKEYGGWWGIPAYAAASYVGWSRVEVREHYTHDVLAGAAIGILANHDWHELHTRHGLVNLTPFLLPVAENRKTGSAATYDGMGLQFSLTF